MDDEVPLLDRLEIWSSCRPCQIRRRTDMLELVEAAGLNGTPVHDQIKAETGQSILLNQAAVKEMMAMARARMPASAPSQVSAKPRLRMSNFPPDRRLPAAAWGKR